MSADGNTEDRDFTETGRLLWRMCFAQNNNNVELISMFRYLKEAGVPYARLHDVGGMF